MLAWFQVPPISNTVCPCQISKSVFNSSQEVISLHFRIKSALFLFFDVVKKQKTEANSALISLSIVSDFATLSVALLKPSGYYWRNNDIYYVCKSLKMSHKYIVLKKAK